MDTLQTYRLMKDQAAPLINDRHLYVANIVNGLFTPLKHRNICEIGAGKLELATILAKSCQRIDAYEMQLPNCYRSKISNLRVYSSFSRYVDVSNYHLLISVCPYYYAYDLFDTIDPERESQNLVTDILDISVENDIDSFLIVSNTVELNDYVEEIKHKSKYNGIVQDEITLHYEKYGEMRTSNNKVLIYKKQI